MCIAVKKIYHLLAFLIAWRRGLVLSFFSKFFLQAALTVTMHFGLIPVLAKVFGYKILIGIILRNNYNLVKGLQQYAEQGDYGNKFFQVTVNTFRYF